LKNQIKQALFVIDQARCHMTEEFKNALRELNIEFYYIPASLTSILQPADLSWFKSLKGDYVLCYNDWFINGPPKRKTKHGNLAGPGYELMTRWLLDGWLKFDQEIIIKSFKSCGITSENVADYHSGLRELLECEELPPNITVGKATAEDDPNFEDTFVYQNEDYYEINLNIQDDSKINLNDDSESDQSYEPEEDSYSDENISTDCTDDESDKENISKSSSKPRTPTHKSPALSNKSLSNTSFLNIDSFYSDKSSPAISFKSPNVSFKSPAVHSKSPAITSKSLNVSFKSPDGQSKSSAKSPNTPINASRYKSVINSSTPCTPFSTLNLNDSSSKRKRQLNTNNSAAKKVKAAEININNDIFCFTCSKEKKKSTQEKQALWNKCDGIECDRWVCENCAEKPMKNNKFFCRFHIKVPNYKLKLDKLQ
jgi:hypothetical protein